MDDQRMGIDGKNGSDGKKEIHHSHDFQHSDSS